MDDIRPPRRRVPITPVQRQVRYTPTPGQPAAQQPVPTQPLQQTPPSAPQVIPAEPRPPMSTKKRRRWPWLFGGLLLALLALGFAAFFWYSDQLRPVSPGSDDKQTFTVVSGMTPDQIGAKLAEQKLIKSELAFMIHTRLGGTRGKLQAGVYRISPGESLSEVVSHIISGKSDTLTVMFYPGAVLRDPTAIADNKRTDVVTMLRRAGFSEADIEAALAKQYTGALFAGKPANASLEGYVYGDTYKFTAGVTAEEVLQQSFDAMTAVVQSSKLEEAARAHGLTLYEAITLASIIQREVHEPADQRQVAQVFYRRLKEGVPLGADATFMYAAQQANKPATITFESPYNTRQKAGLPPGPISVPGKSALEAVANPAPGDYLFFVSGDDGRNYFSHTQAEHDALTRQYCTTLCTSVPLQ